ncbi:MAG: tubulin-dependent ATPase kip3, partial [Paramarteilia canceri]
FDGIISEDFSQKQVFEESTEELINPFIKGENVCIFAYGHTGSGKTHTLVGDINSSENSGMIFRSVDYIFDMLMDNVSDFSKSDIEIKISILEIYNESIYDLLDEKLDY